MCAFQRTVARCEPAEFSVRAVSNLLGAGAARHSRAIAGIVPPLHFPFRGDGRGFVVRRRVAGAIHCSFWLCERKLSLRVISKLNTLQTHGKPGDDCRVSVWAFIAFGELNRRTMGRFCGAEESHRKTQVELEDRIQQRTAELEQRNHLVQAPSRLPWESPSMRPATVRLAVDGLPR